MNPQIKNAIAQKMNPLMQGVSNIGNNVARGAQGVVQGAGQAMGNLGQGIKQGLGQASQAVSNVAQKMNPFSPDIASASSPAYGNSTYFNYPYFQKNIMNDPSIPGTDFRPSKPLSQKGSYSQWMETEPSGVQQHTGGFPLMYATPKDSQHYNEGPVGDRFYTAQDYTTLTGPHSFDRNGLASEFLNVAVPSTSSNMGADGYSPDTGSKTHPAVRMLTDDAIAKLKNDFLAGTSYREPGGNPNYPTDPESQKKLMHFATPAERAAYADRLEAEYKARRDQVFNSYSQYFTPNPALQ